ncbi:YaaR family protein [Fuchsiella alkaliacetigena]|uniref:YaaR family protein n=1 Tax=Fuchsiella alkaliacetigena TaxID=957042 RepID=UPI00200B232A|nr:YaaR family protein [Fuchsiella alkaliacetigena]MCK8824501.1 YaaR family protein [Fuchsiella alkaliacetigena]
MKIQNKLKQDLNQILSKKPTQTAKSSQVEKNEFLDTLQEVQGEQVKDKLDELLSLIDEQGEKLAKNRTFNELVKYKKMVQQFIKETVEQMYNIKEEYGGHRSGQHKVYTLVEKVDQSLEELTDLVLSEQADQLEILDRLDEIRGILVDFYI